ncbi:MAG: PD40 domain-containing protein [Chloroflexota bacterium]|nr:PD40 domain-containing protein [Chloroflexota bacterium]MDE3192746.1 PD40 domain-containing protein [Chloroflexota bacterium]
MARREVTFGVVAALVVAAYAVGYARVSPTLGSPVSAATPTPTRPAEQTGVAKLPGTIAFMLRGDVYVLRNGRYAPLTSEGRNEQPFLSADGSTLYFARKEEIDGQRVVDGAVVNAQLGFTSIVRKGSGGGPETIVLSGLRQKRPNGQHLVSWFLGPAVSPDGKRLAVAEDDGDGAADLALWTMAQTPVRTLLSQGSDLADPAWSPDGTSIAATTYTGLTPGILVFDLTKGGAQRLAGLPEGGAYAPSYSPDGTWILYTLRHDATKNDVHAYDPTSKRDVALTSDGASWNAVFSPDGSQIAFLREKDGTIDLYAMELGDALRGGAPKEAVKVTRGEGIDGSSRPSWAR